MSTKTEKMYDVTIFVAIFNSMLVGLLKFGVADMIRECMITNHFGDDILFYAAGLVGSVVLLLGYMFYRKTNPIKWVEMLTFALAFFIFYGGIYAYDIIIFTLFAVPLGLIDLLAKEHFKNKLIKLFILSMIVAHIATLRSQFVDPSNSSEFLFNVFGQPTILAIMLLVGALFAKDRKKKESDESLIKKLSKKSGKIGLAAGSIIAGFAAGTFITMLF